MQVWTDWAANLDGKVMAAGLVVAALVCGLLFVRGRRTDPGRHALVAWFEDP